MWGICYSLHSTSCSQGDRTKTDYYTVSFGRIWSVESNIRDVGTHQPLENLLAHVQVGPHASLCSGSTGEGEQMKVSWCNLRCASAFVQLVIQYTSSQPAYCLKQWISHLFSYHTSISDTGSTITVSNATSQYLKEANILHTVPYGIQRRIAGSIRAAINFPFCIICCRGGSQGLGILL